MMNRTNNRIASIGLAIGAIFGLAGSLVSGPQLQIFLYEFSSVGLTAACVLLAMKFLRQKQDIVATGFLLLAIGEAVMSVGTAAGQLGGQAAFGAGMALYVPALLFISIPPKFPLWVRLMGIAASIPFAIAAATIFMGGQILSTAALPGAGYGLLTLTIVGWIGTLLQEKKRTAAVVAPKANVGEENNRQYAHQTMK